MGLRGPAPKSEDSHQGAGQPTRLTVLEGQGLTPPPPPTGLLKSTKQAWEHYWSSVVASVATEVDLPALKRLFAYYDQWERMSRIAAKHPFTEGSTGQIKAHPASEQMLKLETVIGNLEKELGLTPYARSRLGLSIGQAKLTAHELNRLSTKEDPSSVDPEIAALLEAADEGA